MSPHIDAHTLNENISQNLPVVLLNCYIDDTSFDSLNIDNFGGAYQMVVHLMQHGYRRIAIIKGTEQNIDAAERLRGYRVAMERGGGAMDPRLVVNGDFSEARAYDATKELLALGPRPEAIFASNDAMAIGSLSALRDAGVHVPGDIALAGFDDIPIAAYLTPALTSVHVGIHNLGVQAIETVLNALRERNNHHKQQIVLKTELRLRESCGCPVADRN
jgi:LacI family transcriptional regulator